MSNPNFGSLCSLLDQQEESSVTSSADGMPVCKIRLVFPNNLSDSEPGVKECRDFWERLDLLRQDNEDMFRPTTPQDYEAQENCARCNSDVQACVETGTGKF